MNQVLNYTGVIKLKSGKWASFTIFLNGFTEKGKFIRPHVGELLEKIYVNG